jgi:hypothetical protein
MTKPLVWPYRLAMSVIVAGCLTLGAIFSYVFWPVRTIYIDTPLKVTPHEVRAGDWIRLNLYYTKPFEHETLVGVMFASKGNIAMTPVGVSALPAGQHEMGMFVQVPSALPPDEYVALVIVERQVRLPLPAVFDTPVVAASEPFHVIR